MNKNFLISGTLLAMIGLMAYGSNPLEKEIKSSAETNSHVKVDFAAVNFVYDVDSRFLKTITKTQASDARTLYNLFSKEEIAGMSAFRDMKITVLSPENEQSAKSASGDFTSTQMKLLAAAPYSSNFSVEAFCTFQNPYTGKAENYNFVYYMTIVPEKEAVYSAGNEGLLNYLKMNSNFDILGVTKEQLSAGKVHFVVSKNGQIKNVRLESSSGYDKIDARMMELIASLPEKWEPATNAKGDNVDQELVFSFGTMGC